jgi:hypothetical protein
MPMVSARARFHFVLAVLAFNWAGPAAGQVITGAVRGGTSTNMPPVVVPGGMAAGALAFVDRAHVFWTDVPAILQGRDFVQVANNDRNVADYTLDVTVSTPSTLYLFIDNRVGDSSNADPPTLTSVMSWVTANGFSPLGVQFGLDEAADGDADQFYSVYSRDVAAGTTRLFELNDPPPPPAGTCTAWPRPRCRSRPPWR